MKGISPMISVVLLLAFTVAIGGIISVWMSGLATTQTTTVSSTTEKQVKCSASILKIQKVRYKSSESTALMNITVVYDSGTENLYNLTIEASGAGLTNRTTDTPNQNFTGCLLYNSTGDPFTPGMSKSIRLKVDGSTKDYVRARMFCQSTVPIISECKAGDACWTVVS
jgi:flagellin-like protein